ncbi:hypothetical protein GCK72_012925 [Caenorhabditis remanei]|uniref:Uncharacterized protein n=1 Tax=Caenorhabditis remanei TaxID=31234 RepID=A0A6A5GQ15_CAERE|nr:hypothetical protein GCK72_012925 [Caenorhabditis remanei]KAF1756472.1 hypothetical protein GCK72_012925 [Caenorhabditis remanei]
MYSKEGLGTDSQREPLPHLSGNVLGIEVDVIWYWCTQKLMSLFGGHGTRSGRCRGWGRNWGESGKMIPTTALCFQQIIDESAYILTELTNVRHPGNTDCYGVLKRKEVPISCFERDLY